MARTLAFLILAAVSSSAYGHMLRRPFRRLAAPNRNSALRAPLMCDASVQEKRPTVTADVIPGMKAMSASPAVVREVGCSSCEAEWVARSKDVEKAEAERLDGLRNSDMRAYVAEIWDYAQHMNDTQRQELALTPDMECRRFVIDSSTPPTPTMERVYNSTMERVPYEQACYICGPEQAMLLRTLVATARPRQALDIGCFTGYASSAILDALPRNGHLTCIEVEPTWTGLASELLAGRNVEFITNDAMATLKAFETEGRRFDFISLDADKPMHGEYYNQSLKLLRPGGVMIMFGMLLFPTVEDQQAMEVLHDILPSDKRILTAQLPVGCGIQLMVSTADVDPKSPPLYYASQRADGSVANLASEPALSGEAAEIERKRYELELELAAIDRLIDADGIPLGGAAASGPGTEALSSAGLVALAAARRPPPEDQPSAM
uniref:Methyltransferase domain-containing protein n=1 Tax=Tisochrysis lutea TaxID=1321669 RepID=X5DCN9_9EUKA|mmetsp:Transcript_13682/g.41652  ORF Transcript_13682/g.41652 Transcript_13682/m.41652 type:complete len:435 (+) Transcript_13682:133-1437(+)|eukprot:scaffold162079_cov36-Tisochrysis_lutea.AAC.1